MTSFINHIFANKCCELSLNYCMGWCFFLCSEVFIILIVKLNPTNINFGEYANTIKFLIVTVATIIIFILARFICYKEKPKEETNSLLYNTNSESYV